MIVRCNKEPLPHCWKDAYPHGDTILLEKDLRFKTLYMKLLVFRNPETLRHWWANTDPVCHGGSVQRSLGIVSSLSCEFRDYSKSERPAPVMEVDRRYFAAMGLARGHLGMEIITHESVHAAFAYAKRTGTKNIWTRAVDGLDEELVCYPAGNIARRVVTLLDDSGMYKKGIDAGGI